MGRYSLFLLGFDAVGFLKSNEIYAVAMVTANRNATELTAIKHTTLEAVFYSYF